MPKRFLLYLALTLALAPLAAKVKALNFENPGNRRLLKLETGNFYYFRAKPEKSMTLDVSGIKEVELRSFAIEPLAKPQVIAIIGKDSSTHDLILQQRLEGFYLYNPVRISIPKGTKAIQILCYDRSVYFRAFHNVTPPPKPKAVKPKSLVVKAHGGSLNVANNGSNSSYYVFNPSQSLKFDLNNGREAVVYVRARLLDRSLPAFEVWRNGELLKGYEFTLKRTTKYKATGIDHLSTGIKITLPDNAGTDHYELRAASDHIFMAKPVLLKKK